MEQPLFRGVLLAAFGRALGGVPILLGGFAGTGRLARRGRRVHLTLALRDSSLLPVAITRGLAGVPHEGTVGPTHHLGLAGPPRRLDRHHVVAARLLTLSLRILAGHGREQNRAELDARDLALGLALPAERVVRLGRATVVGRHRERAHLEPVAPGLARAVVRPDNALGLLALATVRARPLARVRDAVAPRENGAGHFEGASRLPLRGRGRGRGGLGGGGHGLRAVAGRQPVLSRGRLRAPAPGDRGHGARGRAPRAFRLGHARGQRHENREGAGLALHARDQPNPALVARAVAHVILNHERADRADPVLARRAPSDLEPDTDELGADHGALELVLARGDLLVQREGGRAESFRVADDAEHESLQPRLAQLAHPVLRVKPTLVNPTGRSRLLAGIGTRALAHSFHGNLA